MRSALILFLLLVACGKGETAQIGEVVKETVDSVRAKERVVVQVRLDQSEMPNEEELKVRRDLEEQIEVDRIGQVVESGAGVGYYSMTVEVDSTAEAVPRVEAVLRAAGLRERSVVRIE